MRWIRQKLPSLLLVALISISFFMPSAREAHVLCFRLLFHLNGKTFVQGQPSGCVLYIIPNVQFSKGYQEEMRQRSKRSPDDFILAMATGTWRDLKPPSAVVWTNHLLLEWGALTYAWSQSEQQSPAGRTNDDVARHVNSSSLNTAGEVIRLAQAVDGTNGALWLAEALVNFQGQQDEAALASLSGSAKGILAR